MSLRGSSRGAPSRAFPHTFSFVALEQTSGLPQYVQHGRVHSASAGSRELPKTGSATCHTVRVCSCTECLEVAQ